jgi:capsular polysaccharide transport system ATP-binding protein
MIEFQNVTKYFEHKGHKKYLLKDASCIIPDNKNLVVLGENGAGKSVFINLMSNASFPNSGKVITNESISWPVVHKAALINNMTGKENVEFVCMIMHADRHKRKRIQDFIQEFTELGKYYNIEVKTYSKSMRARLSFAICFAFEFDTYLLDDFSFQSDSILAEKAEKFIEENRKHSRFIIATKSLKRIREECHCAVLIKDNQLIYYDNITTAVEECKKMFKNSAELFSEDFDDNDVE